MRPHAHIRSRIHRKQAGSRVSRVTKPPCLTSHETQRVLHAQKASTVSRVSRITRPWRLTSPEILYLRVRMHRKQAQDQGSHEVPRVSRVTRPWGPTTHETPFSVLHAQGQGSHETRARGVSRVMRPELMGLTMLNHAHHRIKSVELLYLIVNASGEKKSDKTPNYKKRLLGQICGGRYPRNPLAIFSGWTLKISARGKH